MRLTLALLRCPDSVTPERRVVSGGEYRIGRGPDNDWVLPDPPRLLSKYHCVVAFRSGAWHVADLSTNGTYLNDETSPVGGNGRPLRNGDRLVLGAYEIEVGTEDTTTHTGVWNEPHEHRQFGSAGRNPFAGEPSSSSGLPNDFNPFGDEPSIGPVGGAGGTRFRPPAQPDHTPAIEDAYRPPAAIVPIPDDWALDFPETTPAPAQPVARTPAPSVPQPRPDRDDLLASLLRGARADGTRVDDPVRTMEALGEVLRAMVTGLRQALIARLSVKGEFRIEQTMIRASGNNPLKFSPSDDDALAALLAPARRGGMQPAAAVAEALRDIQLHELATMTALQEAVRTLVARLDPGAIERQVSQGGFQGSFGKLLNPAKIRAWDAYVSRHAEISEALSEDFDNLFGQAFARAYEQALRDMTDRDRRK